MSAGPIDGLQYIIVNVNGKALGLTDGSSKQGTLVKGQALLPDKTSDQQIWKATLIAEDKDRSQWFSLTNMKGETVLDVDDDGQPSTGTNLQGNKFTGANSQQWYFGQVQKYEDQSKRYYPLYVLYNRSASTVKNGNWFCATLWDGKEGDPGFNKVVIEHEQDTGSKPGQRWMLIKVDKLKS